MNKKKINKRLLIIFLILFPAAVLFGFLTVNTRAEVYVPEESEYNNWRWEVAQNDILAFEVELIMKENDTGDLFLQQKYLEIMQIDDIVNTTTDLMGPSEVSDISAIRMFYNCTSKKPEQIPDSDPFEIAMFGYNETNAPHERYFTGEFIFAPLVLPLNGSTLDSSLVDILNKTFFYNVYKMGYMNSVDESGYDDAYSPGIDKIWYHNTSLDYYMNFTYFENNGTLQTAAMDFLMYFDEGEDDGRWMIVTYLVQRVFEYDITDEVEWAVEEGDTLYFGMGADDETSEYKINITDISCENVEFQVMGEWTLQPFQIVWGDTSSWNGTGYEPEQYDVPLGIANNFYPIHPYVLGSEDFIPILYPNNTAFEDWSFEFNNFTEEHWEFGEVLIHDDIIIEFLIPEEDIHVALNIDQDTGILKLLTYEEEGLLEMVLFRKNVTKLLDGVRFDGQIYSDLIGNNKVFLSNLTLSGDTEIYGAVLPVNFLEPQYGPFIQEIPGLELYIDTYSNNTNLISNPNITILYDTQVLLDLGIPESALKVYQFDMEEHIWEEHVGNYTVINGEVNITHLDSAYHTIGVEESWNWSDDVFSAIDDILIYESLGNLYGNISEFGGFVNIPYINFAILNITNVGLVDSFYQGDPQEFNQVNATLMYYDPVVDDLVTWEDAGEFILSEYYYNQSRKPDPTFYLNLTQNMLGFPIIIPLRWDQLALPTIGRVLNETFYSSPLARELGFPIWDEIEVNTLKNMITFNDTTSDYFMELTYYDNGTLKDAEVATKFTIDDQGIDFNLTSTRLFDYNTTDEVEWGLEVGESYYFGSNYPEGGPTYELNITIVKLNQSAVYLAELFGFDEEAFMFQTWLTFENVWAKMEIWNVSDVGNGVSTGEWIPLDVKQPIFIIAAANNYFPFAPGDYLGYHGLSGSMVPLLLPKGIDGNDISQDFLDFVAIMISKEYGGEVVAAISEVDEDYLKIDLIAPDYPEYIGYLEWYLNNDTGLTRYWYRYEEYLDESYIMSIFVKNHSAGSVNAPYEYNNYLVPDVNVTVNVECVGGYEFFEAMLNKNPVNGSLPSGIGVPMFYTDIFFINYTAPAYNLSFTMELPSKYSVTNVKYLAIYIPNYEEQEGHWESDAIADISFLTVTKDTQNNILTVKIENINGTISVILAWMYSAPAAPGGGGGGGGGDNDEEETVTVPGYNIYILLMILSSISTIMIIKRHKKNRI